jgi:hypothetical protein
MLKKYLLLYTIKKVYILLHFNFLEVPVSRYWSTAIWREQLFNGIDFCVSRKTDYILNLYLNAFRSFRLWKTIDKF